jgi:hypothetical protein
VTGVDRLRASDGRTFGGAIGGPLVGGTPTGRAPIIRLPLSWLLTVSALSDG